MDFLMMNSYNSLEGDIHKDLVGYVVEFVLVIEA